MDYALVAGVRNSSGTQFVSQLQRFNALSAFLSFIATAVTALCAEFTSERFRLPLPSIPWNNTLTFDNVYNQRKRVMMLLWG